MGSPKGLPVPMVLETKDEWFEAFDLAIVDLVNRGGTFTNDDIRQTLPEPGHPNWWGIGYSKAQQQGLIKHAGFKRSSTRSRRHGVTSVWEANHERS